MNAIFTSGLIDDEQADEIVRCAQVVARLYALQLEELDR
jgi:3-oxoacyl-[acyl-carrier-protein] synthase-3